MGASLPDREREVSVISEGNSWSVVVRILLVVGVKVPHRRQMLF